MKSNLKANQVKAFGAEIVAAVLVVGEEDYLEMDERGVLAIPKGAKPQGFHILVATASKRLLVVQRNMNVLQGSYADMALSQLQGFAEGCQATIMREPVVVRSKGPNVWADWGTNKFDLWSVSETGEISLRQIGIFSHDNGWTWKLYGEFRWKGQLYQNGTRIVGKPESPKYGSFEVRATIRENSDFMALVNSAKLPKWNGEPSELEPPLPEVPNGNYAVIDWFTLFGGQTGQGIARLQNGSEVWVHGCDIGGKPDADGEFRLQRGDIISFEEEVDMPKRGSSKLIGVKLQ